MADITFTNRGGFASTEMQVAPTTDAGRAWFAGQFGDCACGATLRKSGAYEMMSALAVAGVTYSVEEVA